MKRRRSCAIEAEPVRGPDRRVRSDQAVLLDPRAARHMGPAELTALQRTAGNRAVTKLVVQRYQAIDHTKYTMGANAKFISTKLEKPGGTPAYTRTTTEMTGAGQLLGDKEQATGGWTKVAAPQPSKPTLNYSTDGADKAMALELTTGEPKVLYATDAVKDESNTKLAQVGARARLEAAGGSLSAPKDLAHPQSMHSLKMLRPATDQTTARGTFTVQEKFGELADCNTFIKNVIGEVGARVAVFGAGAGHEAPVAEEHEPTHEIASFANARPGQGPGALTAHLRATPRGEHDVATPAVAGARARQLGINEHALADVGEGYVISRSGAMPGMVSFDQYLAALDKKTNGLVLSAEETELFRKGWGYHYAGVVARVGNDSATMENYNRGTTAGWELDQVYEDALAQVNAFRAYVQANLARDPMRDEPGTSFANLKQRRIFLKNRADKWRNEAAAAKAQGQPVDQAVEQAVDRAHDAQTKGLAVQDSSLYFFKMYGTAVGQSFHEQWQGSVDDPMTLRLRQSLPAMKTATSDAIAAGAASLDAVGLPPELDGDIDRVTANAIGAIAGATTTAEVTAARNTATAGLRAVAADAVAIWGRLARAEMGEKAARVALPADPAEMVTLLEGWIATGHAVLKDAKARLTARRLRLGAFRDKVEAVRGLNL